MPHAHTIHASDTLFIERGVGFFGPGEDPIFDVVMVFRALVVFQWNMTNFAQIQKNRDQKVLLFKFKHLKAPDTSRNHEL